MSEGSVGRRVFEVSGPYDLVRTMSSITFGPRDPRSFLRPDGFWMAVRTPEGLATWRAWRPDGDTVAIEVWGEGGTWILERSDDLLGLKDGLESFRPDHPLVARLALRFPGVRLPRTHLVMETLVPVIGAQLVTTEEHFRSHRNLVLRHGDEAPGPIRLKVAPSPETLRAMPDHAFTPLGYLMKHTRAIRGVASRAKRMEEASGFTLDDAARRLMAIPGIGPWTAFTTLAKALGHADAVPIGDFHLPTLVAHTLAGETEGTDARMLQLLEPFRPHRYRVLSLIVSGGSGPPRRSPLAPIRPIPTE